MATCFSSQLMVRFWIFTVWLFHGLAIFGLIVMRIRKPHLPRPYKVSNCLITIELLIFCLMANADVNNTLFLYFDENKYEMSFPLKVNILIPIFATLGACYLVIAPLTVFPLEGEFIFTLAVAGSAVIFYVPLVRWNWNSKITGVIAIMIL